MKKIETAFELSTEIAQETGDWSFDGKNG
jgi:hypothetical protein